MVMECVSIRGSWVKVVQELCVLLLQLFCKSVTSLGKKKSFSLKRRRGIGDGWKECEAEESLKIATVVKMFDGPF